MSKRKPRPASKRSVALAEKLVLAYLQSRQCGDFFTVDPQSGESPGKIILAWVQTARRPRMSVELLNEALQGLVRKKLVIKDVDDGVINYSATAKKYRRVHQDRYCRSTQRAMRYQAQPAH